MIRIVFTKQFRKISKDFLRIHPDLLPKFKKTISILRENPRHPSLRLHKLKGSLKNYYSVSMDLKVRKIIDFIIQDNRIILLNIGDHSIYN